MASPVFAPPEIIQAEMFARLPDHHRREGRATAWATARRGGTPIPCFLEGPSFDRAGTLYVTDIPFGRVFRVSPAGEFDLVTEYDGEPNGLKFHRDGRAYITDYRNGIMVLDPSTGSIQPVLDRRYSERFKGVNDLFFADNGDLYFTDQGRTGHQDPTGRVFRWTSGGRLDCLLSTGLNPNGIVLSADGHGLFVAMTNANAVWHLSLMTDGMATSVGTAIQLSGGIGPDGLALTEDGGLVVAHPKMGAVWVFNARGEPIYRVNTAASDLVTNVAFGGPDMRTLYFTDSGDGSIQRARLPVAGRRLFSHSDPAAPWTNSQKSRAGGTSI